MESRYRSQATGVDLVQIVWSIHDLNKDHDQNDHDQNDHEKYSQPGRQAQFTRRRARQHAKQYGDQQQACEDKLKLHSST